MSDWLLDEHGLDIVRRAYARQMLGVGDVRNDRLEQIFAAIRREDFLGTEPWTIVRPLPGGALPSNDPVYAYQDVVIALAPERGVNNGSPSLHARMLNDLAVEPGQHIAHIGAGAGYYTAMLAELTGPSGRVTAIEFDPRLAERACDNLAPWSHVDVLCGDGAELVPEGVDRIYVNFAVAAPAAAWTERLKPGGKLLFPLGAPNPAQSGKFPKHSAQGAAFLIERRPGGFSARWLYTVYFVCAEGALGAEAEAALFEAFKRGGAEFVQSLRWNEQIEPRRCWYWTPRWSLAFDPLDEA
jgi:protein-L-isoaspartate(D-aspartate) O-methyltransferase